MYRSKSIEPVEPVESMQSCFLWSSSRINQNVHYRRLVFAERGPKSRHASHNDTLPTVMHSSIYC